FPGSRRPRPPVGAFWLRSGRLPPAPSTPSSAIACQSRPNTTTQAAASPFGVVSHAVVVAGRLHSPTPPPPAAVSSLSSGTYTKAPEPPDLSTIRVTHLAKKPLP